jgi:peptidoglycan/xylan/chitin deacetylase (PgdA/CDA1 family)
MPSDPHQSFVGLMYHNVVESAEPYSGLSPSITRYFVSRAAFAQQMQTISELGTCWGADELAGFFGDSPSGTDPHGARGFPVMITFDDGWRGAVEIGGPILESFGWRAFLFVATDFVGRRHFLSRSELQGVPQNLFYIGSHGRTHRLLNRLSDAEILEELRASKAFLEDAIGNGVQALSIPGGAYDERVTRLAADTGYRYVFTSDVHVNRSGDISRTLGRVAIKSTTTAAAFRRYLRHRLGRERLRQWLLRTPKYWLGAGRYERLRRQLLGETAGQLDMQDLCALEKHSPS